MSYRFTFVTEHLGNAEITTLVKQALDNLKTSYVTADNFIAGRITNTSQTECLLDGDEIYGAIDKVFIDNGYTEHAFTMVLVSDDHTIYRLSEHDKFADNL